MGAKTNQIDRCLRYLINQQNIGKDVTLPMILPHTGEGMIAKTRFQKHSLLKLCIEYLVTRKKLLPFSK
jgi:hypothetical protein